MKFSVIVPVYNGVKYLKNSIESVLRQGQDGRFSLEVILVENGSTDDSPRVCDEYAASYHMITALHREKIGAYAARRLGMDTATGEWLLFLDADDELEKNSLLALCDFISGFGEFKCAPDIIFYDYNRVSGKSSELRTFPFEAGKLYRGAEKKIFYDTMCQGDLLNPLWNKCVKKELAGVSLTEDKTIFLNHGEDLLQTAQLLDRAQSIAYMAEPVYRYNTESQGLTGSYRREFLENQKYAWQELTNFSEKWANGSLEYTKMLNERKTLTTCIAAKSISLSDMTRSEVSRKLKELFEDPFYKEYCRGSLPEWAPEEDVFFHNLQISDNPYKTFMGYITKHRIKEFIKKRIRK